MKLTKQNKKILKKMGLKPKKKILNKLTEKQRYKYNTIRQKMEGKKKYDYIEITEPGSFNRPLHKYENIKEWDKRNFDFQEKWIKKENKRRRKWQIEKGKQPDPVYEKKGYENLYINGDWFRLLKKRKYGKRQLIYGMLESAYMHILVRVSEELGELIDKEIPSLIIDASHEKDEKTGLTKVEFETRAAGREKELNELREKKRKLDEVLKVDVQNSIKDIGGYTFIKEDSDKINGLDIYVIGGTDAAENMSFKTFVKDFEQREQPFKILDNKVEILVNKYSKLLFDN